MENCFVKKFKRSTGNSLLVSLGELKLKISKVSQPSRRSQKITISVNKPVVLTITGEGYFTDSTLSANFGKNKEIQGQSEFYVSNGDYEISVSDKYAITTIYLNEISTESNRSIDLSDLRYSKNLVALLSFSKSTIGDLNSISNILKLDFLNLSYSGVKGDIKSISNLTNLTFLDLSYTSVKASLNYLSKMLKLVTLRLSNVNGDLTQLYGLPKLSEIWFRGKTNVSGDLSMMPASTSVIFFEDTDGSTISLKWTNRSSDCNIIGLIGDNINIDNVDKMLQDQAECKASVNNAYKRIVVRGTRTSASDAAISTLQQKGYTVSITPA